MIKIIHNEVDISGLDIENRYREPGQLESYLSTTMSRAIAHFLLEEKMIHITSKYSPHYDTNTYKATLYVATEEDYINQERGVTNPYSEEEAVRRAIIVRKEVQTGYERGVRVALASVAAAADGMKNDRLKKNQHAAAVLIETATEVEEVLI